MDTRTLDIVELAILRVRDRMASTFPHNLDVVAALGEISKEMVSLRKEMQIAQALDNFEAAVTAGDPGGET